MVDDLDFTFFCKHISMGDIHRNIKVSTGEIRDYRKVIEITNKYGNKLFVKSENNGEQLRVKTCPPKFLQGHNLFGSNNVIGIAIALVIEVIKGLNITISESELSAIKRGDFNVNMIGIAWSYHVKSNLIPAIINEVGNHWRSKGEDVSNYKKQTVYLRQHSKTLAFKLYDKKSELGKRPLPPKLPQRDKLLEYSKGKIRAELILRSPALNKYGLTRGRNWSIVKVKEMMQLAINNAAFSGSIKRKLMPSTMKRLKPNLRQIYAIWSSGFDVNEFYDQQTLRRHRYALSRLGFNINQPPDRACRTQKVEVASLFNLENKLNFPKWARDNGLIFLPEKVV